MVKKISLLQFYGVEDSIEARKAEVRLEKLQARSLKRAAERQVRRDAASPQLKRAVKETAQEARGVLENLFFDLEESRRVGFECEIDAFEEDLNLPWLKGLISEMKDQSVTDWLIFAQRCAKTGVMV